MKKTLRFLIVLILVIAAAVLILALYEPQDVTVSRSVTIKAPKDTVFGQIVLFRNWPNWSPWYKIDPTMKLTYYGTDGQPGSGYHWVGAENMTGEGDMKNTGVDGTAMNYTMSFIKPVAREAHGQLNVADTAGMAKVTWGLTLHTPFPLNAMNVFINYDKLLGGDFDKGLGYLKQYAESHTNPAPQIQITEVDYPARTFEGIRQTVAMDSLAKVFNNGLTSLAKDLKDKINGPAAGLFYTWDTTTKTTDMAVAFPVADTTLPVTGGAVIHAGPAKAYMAVMKGGYSNAMMYHTALAKRLAEKGQTQNLVIEEYITGPHQEADSNKWVTNIYYLIQ